jgi:purine-binding chemotaxis protein CheW
MSNALDIYRSDARVDDLQTRDFVTMTIAGQLFGIPVLQVQDVLGPQRIARIPLAPSWVAGALNLRGRIVTAIDVRRRLGLPANETTGAEMSIVIEQNGELYSLIVDEVGEVMTFPETMIGPNPPTLDPVWREVSLGIIRLENRLLVILDIKRLFDLTQAEAA